MRLYGAIEKVEPQDDGTVRVHGIATSETVDDQGEIVRADAIRAALPDYMRFPALREMHQLSAAGTMLEAEVGDGALHVVVEANVEDVGDGEAAEEVVDRMDEPFAELGEMLHQAHAGKFGAFRYRFACLVNRVEIRHVEWPRWSRLPMHLLPDRDRAGWNRERGRVRSC